MTHPSHFAPSTNRSWSGVPVEKQTHPATQRTAILAWLTANGPATIGEVHQKAGVEAPCWNRHLTGSVLSSLVNRGALRRIAGGLFAVIPKN